MKCPKCGREGTVVLSGNVNSLIEGYCNLCGEDFSLPFWPEIGKGYDGTKKKKEIIMQVTYNGFTGELVKLERRLCAEATFIGISSSSDTMEAKWKYDISIYDSEKQVTHSFAGVNLENVKFLGGAVSFGG